VSACEECLRRAWLLSSLGACLDYLAPDRDRLAAALALGDRELIGALGGRRRAELRADYAAFASATVEHTPGVTGLCHHDRRYPRALSGAAAPRMLHLAGPVQRLERLVAAPVVALLGCARASDYGLETARGLARGLAASGVAVASTVAAGIPLAAQRGALEGGGGLAVFGHGLGVSSSGLSRALLGRRAATGCAVSELPCHVGGRRWGPAAAERIVVGLAPAVVVVEAGNLARDLAGARLAQSLGRHIAAVPGRVSSPLSQGPHLLLREGAWLARGTEDVLELLSRAGVPDLARAPGIAEPLLTPALQAVLERVACGHDTPERLAAGMDIGIDELLLALSELELQGALTRGENGRYLPAARLADGAAGAGPGPHAD
jgi:DNA processing protein